MPVRSSVCTYSPLSASGRGESAGAGTSKYSSILPTSSSLSHGHYKPLASLSGGCPTVSQSSGRYSRLGSSYKPSLPAPHSAAASSCSSSASGLYKSLSPSSAYSSRHQLSSPSSRYSTSSSTGSLASTGSTSSGAGEHLSSSYSYRSPGLSSASLASSAYSSAGSSSSASLIRASRRLSSASLVCSQRSPREPLPAEAPSGLINLGNTCYMNASLQALYAIEPFRNLLLGRGQLVAGRGGPLTSELSDLFKSMAASPTETPASPANFKFAFSRHQSKFSGFGQQDAQEFLRYLINGIHEEANAATRRPRRARQLEAPKSAREAWGQYRELVDDSPLVDLLVGQLCSTITCCECQHKSLCWDPFWDLSLPLPARGGSGVSWRSSSRLSELLEDFTARELLDADERPVCARCNRATKSTKQISLARLPPVLILHLKKFTNDGYKLTSPAVQVDRQLSLDGAAYQLKACVSHHGHSATSGHYTSHCEYASRWLHFDDGQVRDESANFDCKHLDEAYVLVYQAQQAISQSKL